jgi:hypothetical protein
MSEKVLLVDLINNHISIVGEIRNAIHQRNFGKDFKEHRLSWYSFSEQEQKRLAISKQLLGIPTLLDFINSLEQLPLIQILPENDIETAFIENQKLAYKEVASWLRKNLFKISSLPWSIQTTGVNEAYAAMSAVRLTLAKETYDWCPDLKTLFPSAEALWICCEFSISKFNCRENGLTGKPIIRSKSEVIGCMSKVINNFYNCDDLEIDDVMQFANQQFIDVDFSEHIIDLLILYAEELCKEEALFKSKELLYGISSKDLHDRYRKIYEIYWKNIRGYADDIKNNSSYQISYLKPNGQVFTTQKGAKIPRSYKPPKSTIVTEENDIKLVTQAELAERLRVHRATLTKNRDKDNFANWSKRKDPDGFAWHYDSRTERFHQIEE